MKALFTSKNLIGDGLYIQPSLKQWQKEHPDWEIELLTNDDHISYLYNGMGISNMQVVFGPLHKEYDFEHVFDVSKAFELGNTEKLHIVQAYARLLGVTLPEEHPRVEYTPPILLDEEIEKGLVLFSMFSNSCASREGKPPNKMLSWGVWLAILHLLRQLGKVAFLGGPKDIDCPLPIKEEEFYNGLPLEQIARLMSKAKMLITIDNGMGHLAATQNTPTILFYPACLGTHWIIPSGNSGLFVYQMDPMKLTPTEALMVVRQGIKALKIGGLNGE